jgi:AraC-like DNA-binding protein
VHPVHLARAFRAHRGMTVGDYLRRLRATHAATLLEAPGAALSSVAIQAGFGDQSQFTRTLKRVTGVTPGEFGESPDRMPAAVGSEVTPISTHRPPLGFRSPALDANSTWSDFWWQSPQSEQTIARESVMAQNVASRRLPFSAFDPSFTPRLETATSNESGLDTRTGRAPHTHVSPIPRAAADGLRPCPST